jgi:hypothetical protein
MLGITMRHPETLQQMLPGLIRNGLFVAVDALLAVAAVILAMRGTLKSSTYQLWLLIIAIGFLMHFGLGLISGVDAAKFMIRYDFAHHKFEYYNLVGAGMITLIYGGLAVIAFVLSRRTKQSQSSMIHLSEQA